MVDVTPFKGLLYNQEVVDDLAAVVTPPFDVISPEEQEMYHHYHPYNMIRLILGRKKPGDDEKENWYTRAAATLQTWQREEVLIRDSQPAIYDYEMEYLDSYNLRQTRQGFICMVRLQEFSQGSVYPHERTYEDTKSDRLQLMLASNANFSQVFALYGDPSQQVSKWLQEGREDGSVFDFLDNNGMRHRMWRVSRKDTLTKVRSAMREKPLFIADGHHRYETALNYRRIMQQRYPKRGELASFNYILMYLSNMNQKGSSILPTHRLCVHLPQFRLTSFLRRAEEYFEVEHFPFERGDRSKALSVFLTALQAAADRHFIGVYETGADGLILLKLRDDVDHSLWRNNLPEPLQRLDVVVLTELVFKHFLAMDGQTLDDETQIQYCHDAREALEQVDQGKFQVAFLINPTRIEQVQEVASSALIMPHKSTYFYPKVIDGSVINILDPNEDVPV
jgi:uncharacterized protein (DUF1015 family)